MMRYGRRRPLAEAERCWAKAQNNQPLKNITKVSFGARQTLDLHGQPGRVTADDCDARSGQGRRLRKRLILSAVKYKAQQVIRSAHRRRKRHDTAWISARQHDPRSSSFLPLVDHAHALPALTGSDSADNFDPLREYLGANSLSPREKSVWRSLTRRNFLIRCCQGASASLLPASLRDLAFAFDSRHALALESEFHLHPHYRAKLPLEATLLKTESGLDVFITEKYAEQIAAILAQGSAGLLRSPRDIQAVERVLTPDFVGSSLQPAESRLVHSGPALEIHQNKFARQTAFGRDAFVQGLP